ncbi:hypothetical protein PYCCODRAFT_1426788 [Trametes coccinea BRFM310]|uniref:Uncharacterized protein n=1 Tax=Trametes coccinea (strain BRFM310) TaxID=1353009 RepID=A0A1Y2IFU8_TRAC3|nr:hypothetical protein PYCCODRAFT_1426788 [Trametes coccinea BRFM310]
MIPIAFLELAILVLEIAKTALAVCPVPGLSAVVEALLGLAKKFKVFETNEQAVQELIGRLNGLLVDFDAVALSARRCSSFWLIPEPDHPAEVDSDGQRSPLEELIGTLRVYVPIDIQLQVILCNAIDLQSNGALHRLLRSAEDRRCIQQLKEEVGRILAQFTASPTSGRDDKNNRSLCGSYIEALLHDFAQRFGPLRCQAADIYRELAALHSLAVKNPYYNARAAPTTLPSAQAVHPLVPTDGSAYLNLASSLPLSGYPLFDLTITILFGKSASNCSFNDPRRYLQSTPRGSPRSSVQYLA